MTNPRQSWIGCIGPDAGGALGGFARDTNGHVRAAIGNDTESGCSATILPNCGGVTLACDPFGLYSIFTAREGERLWFASDFHLLRRNLRIDATVRPKALHGYLCFSYVPTPTTLAAEIDVLPAGTRQTITAPRFSSAPSTAEPLWPAAEPSNRCEEAAVSDLRERLRAAVARQLGAGRDVGVFLSGGLDSSLVAALLVEAGARVRLYTLDFGAPYNAELVCARQVATHLRLPLCVVPAGVKEIEKALHGAAAAMQQPFGDGVTVPLYLLGKSAANHVETVFNGEFGDQLFGGWANKPMIAAELYGAADYRRETAYLATFHRFHGETDSLYSPGFRRAVADVDVESWIKPALETDPGSSLLHSLRTANLRLKGAQNIAPRARQLAEAHGLAVCSPFCDRELAEWTFRCPPDWFLKGSREKYLLKRAAEPYLPGEIVWREKRGMGVPTTDWCLGGLKKSIGGILQPRRIKRDGVFSPEAVRALCRGSDRPGEFRARRLGEKLWTLFMLNVWQDVHEIPYQNGVGR